MPRSKEQDELDRLLTAELVRLYEEVRAGSKKISSKWAKEEPVNLTQSKQKKLYEEVESLRPDLVKADNFMKERITAEYGTAYYQAGFYTVQVARKTGYNYKQKKYSNKKFLEAIFSPLSKSDASYVVDRNVAINRLYDALRKGLTRGDSLVQMNKELDKILGFRDSKGRLIKSALNYKGEFYKRMRVLRTEIGRVRSLAETEQWLNEQDQGVESNLVYSATLDTRTRAQSGSMDGQRANKEGKFKYPNGEYYFQKSTGRPEWDINDRCTTITTDPDFPPAMRSRRVMKNGKWEVETVPYQSFKEYAKDIGLKVNKYGQVVG